MTRKKRKNLKMCVKRRNTPVPSAPPWTTDWQPTSMPNLHPPRPVASKIRRADRCWPTCLILHMSLFRKDLSESNLCKKSRRRRSSSSLATTTRMNEKNSVPPSRAVNDDEFPCPYCPTVFAMECRYRDHMLNVHGQCIPPLPPLPNLFKCKRCAAPFVKNRSCTKHENNCVRQLMLPND